VPKKGNKKNIVLVSAILLFSLSLMTLNVKQEKGTTFLDSIAGVILSPFQSFFTQAIQSVSDSITHYFFLVDVAKENDRLKLEIQRLISEKTNSRNISPAKSVWPNSWPIRTIGRKMLW
jgi:cell shape-determining protein MreC